LAAMLLHQSDGTFTDFRGKLVALAHGSIFSRNAASSKPGVIHNSYERFVLRREKAAGVEEGLKKGMRQGKIEGQHEGASTLLRTLLHHKFGAIPDWAATRIAEADAVVLQQWGLNILDAKRLEDVFRD
ncbi:hypothetical protein H0A73_21100, partial [Alcaligenaceae bacterium]|nr:hypothetical protein [Alcaligenaceae bacterium]